MQPSEVRALTSKARHALREAEQCEAQAAQLGDEDAEQRQELLVTARVFRLTADELASVALEFAKQ